jgi:hypothetical protein
VYWCSGVLNCSRHVVRIGNEYGLSDFYRPGSTVMAVKSSRLLWTGNIIRTGKKREIYRIFAFKTVEKQQNRKGDGRITLI